MTKNSTKDATIATELRPYGLSRSGESIVDAKGNPIVACLTCSKVYNDRRTRTSATGPHCPYCGSAYTRELDWDTSARWLAEAIRRGSSQIGRLSRCRRSAPYAAPTTSRTARSSAPW